MQARLLNALQVSIPRTLQHLGQERVMADFEAFLHCCGPCSHYLHDLGTEFVEFCLDRWRDAADVPAFVVDLARHELLALEVAAALDDVEVAPATDVTVATQVRFQRAARLVRYDFAVHRLPEDAAEPSVPEPGRSVLLAYRDIEHRVLYLELTELAAALTERLLAGENLGAATTGALTALSLPAEDGTLAQLAAFLDDLEKRGVLCGHL